MVRWPLFPEGGEIMPGKREMLTQPAPVPSLLGTSLSPVWKTGCGLSASRIHLAPLILPFHQNRLGGWLGLCK